MILLRRETVEQFKPNITGRPERGNLSGAYIVEEVPSLAWTFRVQVRPGQQGQLIEKLKDNLPRGKDIHFPARFNAMFLKMIVLLQQ